jgi:hypothetical protein
MSTSRSSQASPTAAAGASTDAATHRQRNGRRPVTGSYTPRSMTAPESSTPRSIRTNKPSPPSASGTAPTSSSTNSASPSNASSPTTVPATDPSSGGPRSKTSEPLRSSRAPTGLRPTAKSSDITGSCSKNGPTSATGTPTANAQITTSTSSTSTITTEHTAHSDGPHQSQRSRTTSPVITPSTSRRCGRRRHGIGPRSDHRPSVAVIRCAQIDSQDGTIALEDRGQPRARVLR